MAQTITPVVHGGSRRRWAGAVALHVLGAAVSAATLGAVLGAAGSILGAPWGRGGMVVAALVALAYAAREILGVRVPILEMRRQVPEHWRGSFGPRTVALLYGIALGPGFLTHLRHGTFVAVAAVALALGDAGLGAMLLVPFGVARAAGIALSSAARTEPAVMAAGERLERIGSGAAPRIANAAALLALAGVALATRVPSGSPAGWPWPALLSVTFAWAALAKLIGREAWHDGLRAHALPRRVERVAELSVPMVEGSVALLLLIGSVELGAVAALALLAGFSAALMRARTRGQGALPCGCFGGRRRRSVSWLLARNGVLAVVAVAALAFGAPIPLPSAPGPGEMLPAMLSMTGLGLAVWLALRGANLSSTRPVRR